MNKKVSNEKYDERYIENSQQSFHISWIIKDFKLSLHTTTPFYITLLKKMLPRYKTATEQTI